MILSGFEAAYEHTRSLRHHKLQSPTSWPDNISVLQQRIVDALLVTVQEALASSLILACDKCNALQVSLPAPNAHRQST